MSLINYILNGPSVVIQDDKRDPFISWRNHMVRAGVARGGVDLVAKVGTPILAPTDGWVRRRPNNGSAGNSMWFEHRDNKGWGDVFSHLSSYSGSDNQFFKQGQTIALSGNSGGVDEHLHRHLEYQGVRYNPWNYFSSESSTTGLPQTPVNNNTQGDDDMAFQVHIQENGGLGRTLFIEPGIVTHVVHDDVVNVNNYVGVPGGGALNLVSLSDARRLIEVRGFNWDQVNGLQAGQAVLRDSGRIVNAGAAKW